MDGIADSARGFDPGAARNARAGTWKINVTTRGPLLCVSSANPSFGRAIASACVSGQRAASDGLFMGTEPPPGEKDSGIYYVGVLPDGVTSVDVSSRDGSTKRLAVDSNVIAERLTSHPERIQFLDRTGIPHAVTVGPDKAAQR